MRIGIDVRLALGRRRGMGRALLNLLTHLSQIDKANTYFLYLDRADTQAVLPKASNFETRVFPPRLYPVWEQISLPLLSIKDKLQILHCPANTAPFLLPRGVKLIVTLHDVIFLKPLSEVPLSSSMYQNLGRLYRRLCAAAIRKNADLVITVSKWSRQEIQERLGIKADRIRVIYNGVDDVFFNISTDMTASVLRQLGIDSPYILHLGAIAPHKNTAKAVEAFHLLTQHTYYAHIKLVIIGLSPDAARNLIPSLRENSQLLEKVIFLGYVDDHELACLYKGAELLLFPSLWEGFGLPALEAMACGTPVVASNRASIPEVTGGAALLVDPTKPEEISHGMQRILEDTALRSEIVRAGIRRAMEFRWEIVAKQVLSAYREVLEA